MEECRFEKFILAVEGIHKAVQKIKLSEAPKFGLKGVHLFWLCELERSKEGMTACELAERDVCGRAACTGRAALGSTGVCWPRGAGCAGRCGFC